MPKTVLITGGAGFIGSHLCELYLKHKWKVIALDDLSTGHIDNLSRVKDHRQFELVVDSVLKEKTVDRLCRRADLVIHLAAAVGVEYIIDNPLRSLEVNIVGTDIVLQSCNRHRRKVLLASTSEVYGKNEKIPFHEDDNSVLGPTTITRWSYACSKAIDEFFALAYYREKKLPVVIMRFFNTCGPRQTGRYGMVIPRFVKQALTNKPLTIYGDGRQTRCFTHVDDVIHFIYALSQSEKAVGQVFNIGSTNRISITRLARLIIRKTGSASTLKYLPYDQAFEKGFEDMRHRVPDISRIVKLTGIRPRRGIDDIIQDVINYHRS